MKRQVEVSVIVPVYNTGKTAVKLAKKLLGDNERLEVILVDDGSTDDSWQVLQDLNDKRIKKYRKENGGPSAARNYGIEKASGEYLMFVDSDDDVKVGFVEKMLEAINSSDVALAVCGVKYKKIWLQSEEDVYLDGFLYEENEDNKGLVLRSLLHDGRMYPAFNKIFKSEVIKKNDLKFDESMKFGEDTKFVLDYLTVAEGEIRFVLEPLYVYNAGTSTSTAKKMEKEWKNWQRCFGNLKKWVGKANFREKRLLALIYLKWRASWLKSRI